MTTGIAAVPVAPKLLQHVGPGLLRQHDVEQDQVGRGVVHLRQTVEAVPGDGDVIVLPLEPHGDQFGHVRLVLDDHDPLGAMARAF